MRTPAVRRGILRAIAAGAVTALVVLALIKGFRPYMFEDRIDRVIEQCFKTGLAVFAFSLLLSLGRSHKPGS